jgi:hypothetical protein
VSEPEARPQVCPFCGTVMPRDVNVEWVAEEQCLAQFPPTERLDEYQCVEGCGRSFWV